MNFYAIPEALASFPVLSISFDFNFLPLLIVMAIAWLIPMVMSFFKIDKIPTVVVEIVAGYVIGQLFAPQFEGASFQNLEFLALAGFLFLMFQSGLEIDSKKLWSTLPRKKMNLSRFLSNPLLVGATIFLITLLLSYLSSWALSTYMSINNVWYFSLIMVTTSVGIIVPVLKNRGEINSRFGQMVVIAAAVADILSILLFTFTAFIIKHGFQVKVILIILPFIVFYVFYRGGRKLNRIQLFRRLNYELAHATSQIKVRGTFLLILFFLVVAQYLGNEITLLGAFLAGLLLAFFIPKTRSLLLLQLDGMSYGFFIPIFFIMVGIKFDPATLNEFHHSYIYILLLLLLILFLVKIIPAMLWSRLFGFRKALSGGVLIASRLSLIIAASQIGLDHGIITPGMNASVIIMAVITCLFSPVLYNFIHPSHYIEGEKTVIVGGSDVGVLLAQRLQMHGKTAVIIENSLQRYRDLKAEGLNVILGNGGNMTLYKEIALKPNDFVVVLTHEDNQNYKISARLKRELGHEKIITNVQSKQIEQKLAHMEISSLDNIRIMATTIENFIIRPTTYHALVETFENFVIEEIRITNQLINGMLIKHFPVPGESYLMLLKRGDYMYIPKGDSDLQTGDIVTVFGTESALKRIREQLV